MSESDGLDEVVENMLRTGLTAAGRIGEQIARAREKALRLAQAGEDQQGRELQARFDAERAAARAQLTPALDNRWWDSASERDILRVHETATAWKSHDPLAVSAAETIREQVQRRHGIDMDTLGAGESAAAALAEAERAKTQTADERATTSAQNVHAAQSLAEAERQDKARKQEVAEDNARPEELAHEAALNHDSAERREALAKSLEGVGDNEAMRARLMADRDQATPPAAAISTAHGKTPKARKTRGAPGVTRQVQKGMSR